MANPNRWYSVADINSLLINTLSGDEGPPLIEFSKKYDEPTGRLETASNLVSPTQILLVAINTLVKWLLYVKSFNDGSAVPQDIIKNFVYYYILFNDDADTSTETLWAGLLVALEYNNKIKTGGSKPLLERINIDGQKTAQQLLEEIDASFEKNERDKRKNVTDFILRGQEREGVNSNLSTIQLVGEINESRHQEDNFNKNNDSGFGNSRLVEPHQ